MASPPRVVKLSQFAPLVPVRVSSYEREEEQLLADIDEVQAALQQQNELLLHQQHNLDTIHSGNQEVTARLEDALKETAETERLRSERSKMTGAAGGVVTGAVAGAFAGPAAIVASPAAAAAGGFAGWGLGSLVAAATNGAVDRELSRHNERYKPQKGAGGEGEEKGDGAGKSRKGKERETSEKKNSSVRHSVKDGRLVDGRVVVSVTCWESERYASKTWDQGNLTTGERGRWSVEDQSGHASPAVLHPEPMLEKEMPVEWFDDWVSEELVDSETKKPKKYGKVGKEEGWQYAPNWDGPWTPRVRWNSYVRKRSWMRVGEVLPEKDPEPGSAVRRKQVLPSSGHFGGGNDDEAARVALFGSAAAAAASSQPSADPNELFLYKLREIKQALGEGARLLYHQGEQLRETERETVRQAGVLKTAGKIQGLSSFHNVIWSYLTPVNWFAPKPFEKPEPDETGPHAELREWGNDGWEFEGRDPTVSERLMMETHEVSSGARLIGGELSQQSSTLETISTNQGKNSDKIKKLTARVEKQL